MKKSTTAVMAFPFVYWIIILLSAGILDARTTGNIRELAGTPNGLVPRTSFTCSGRPPGYYADVETDCQVYHLCEQGRQYSYTCPNATLFQQRMLVCDHWYMVNCSKSEENYRFNDLIGQRDQPFVSDIDVQNRTPRSDILDRPYAPDYKGESFRKQIVQSNFPSLQNAISGIDLSKNINRKYEILETQASSNILPPQIDSNSLDPTLLPASEEFPQFDKFNDRRNAFSGESEESNGKGLLPPPTGFEPPRVLPNSNDQFRATEERRLRDLGLPLATPTRPTRTKASQPTAQNVKQGTKKPGSQTFNPDKNYAAFEHFFPSGKATHDDYDFSKYFPRREGVQTTRKAATSNFNARFNNDNNKKSPVGPPATQRPTQFNSGVNRNVQRPVATTARPVVRQQPIVVATKAPVTFKAVATTKATPRVNKPVTPASIKVAAPVKVTTQATFAAQRQQQVTKTPTSFQNQVTQAAPRTQQKQQGRISVPSQDLELPFDIVKVYDDATTRGPPVYYDLKEKISEWRVPDNGLIPPKFDNETDSSPKRSLLEEGNHGQNSDIQSSETRRFGNSKTVKIQYKDLQKYFAIPEIEFPIEDYGRDGYDKDDAVNSFQVKIPYREGNNKVSAGERYYYLEHSHCNPECHPYFFKPGRCEPCIKL
ncbi:unnamed protein product [Chironomus riparius]|uniref:Chitin-binding type-2 domain-containing protein n=1 Tax=Chironomus riparius TaxID=315576 RepID=A0A9N9WW37_9DIPT|nr:unnamed protein product [Chironomus riparius]